MAASPAMKAVLTLIDAVDKPPASRGEAEEAVWTPRVQHDPRDLLLGQLLALHLEVSSASESDRSGKVVQPQHVVAGHHPFMVYVQARQTSGSAARGDQDVSCLQRFLLAVAAFLLGLLRLHEAADALVDRDPVL